jgi:hypothetical protein
MSFDPYAPYGAMLETTCRLVTWNVWGRYGEWPARLDGIIAELERSAPTSCELLGVRPRQEAQLSDHYGVAADLRY